MLAQLWLGLHDNGRTWKGFDLDAMDRLHRKGMIFNPAGCTRSLVFPEKGEGEAKRPFCCLFTKAG